MQVAAVDERSMSVYSVDDSPFSDSDDEEEEVGFTAENSIYGDGGLTEFYGRRPLGEMQYGAGTNPPVGLGDVAQ